jgi:ribosome recycling factor
MSADSFDISLVEDLMKAAIDALKREFSGLRTGRASAHLLDPVQVMVYGSKMPLNQVATVSVPEPRTISVQVWDNNNVGPVEKAIREANLGINPVIDGALIRLPIPPLTAERRQEMVKLGHKYAEHTKVSVRNARREGLDLLKQLEKDGMSKDEHHRHGEEVQQLTDNYIKDVDALMAAKEKEITTV